jgi:hypothetical protein
MLCVYLVRRMLKTREMKEMVSLVWIDSMRVVYIMVFHGSFFIMHDNRHSVILTTCEKSCN